MTGAPGLGSPADPVRVFLVDDQELVRAGFAMILDATPGMAVAGQAGDGQEALDRLGALTAAGEQVDVVLMDIQMPRLDGISATRQLLLDPGAPRVVVLTTFEVEEQVVGALRAGASGYLLKDAGPADLLAAIRAAHAGESVVSPRVTRRLIDSFVLDGPGGATNADESSNPPRLPDAAARLPLLTDREREVLVSVGRGLSNQEIATELLMAEGTVKTHLGSILRKLELRDRVQVVVLAHEARLV